ncbi:MAG: toxic anion resistance protein, partial [Roseovarius sp.]
MSETTRQKAEAVLKDVEAVSRAVLPEPTAANAIVPLEQADAPQSAEITRRMAEIDMSDTQSIVSFGSA